MVLANGFPFAAHFCCRTRSVGTGTGSETVKQSLGHQVRLPLTHGAQDWDLPWQLHLSAHASASNFRLWCSVLFKVIRKIVHRIIWQDLHTHTHTRAHRCPLWGIRWPGPSIFQPNRTPTRPCIPRVLHAVFWSALLAHLDEALGETRHHVPGSCFAAAFAAA